LTAGTSDEANLGGTVSGWAYKRGADGNLDARTTGSSQSYTNHSWKQYFFILDPPTAMLSWYTDELSFSTIGVADVTVARVVPNGHQPFIGAHLGHPCSSTSSISRNKTRARHNGGKVGTGKGKSRAGPATTLWMDQKRSDPKEMSLSTPMEPEGAPMLHSLTIHIPAKPREPQKQERKQGQKSEKHNRTSDHDSWEQERSSVSAAVDVQPPPPKDISLELALDDEQLAALWVRDIRSAIRVTAPPPISAERQDFLRRKHAAERRKQAKAKKHFVLATCIQCMWRGYQLRADWCFLAIVRGLKYERPQLVLLQSWWRSRRARRGYLHLLMRAAKRKQKVGMAVMMAAVMCVQRYFKRHGKIALQKRRQMRDSTEYIARTAQRATLRLLGKKTLACVKEAVAMRTILCRLGWGDEGLGWRVGEFVGGRGGERLALEEEPSWREEGAAVLQTLLPLPGEPEHKRFTEAVRDALETLVLASKSETQEEEQEQEQEQEDRTQHPYPCASIRDMPLNKIPKVCDCNIAKRCPVILAH
jgi:hypothetical protein